MTIRLLKVECDLRAISLDSKVTINTTPLDLNANFLTVDWMVRFCYGIKLSILKAENGGGKKPWGHFPTPGFTH